MAKTEIPESLAQCVLLNTIKAARSLSRRYDNRLKPFGVTVVQFSVLAAIRYSEGETINAIAERIAVDRSTLTRNIDLLAEKGLVVKESAVKGNAKTCRLTDEGNALLDALIPQWRQVRDELRDLMAGKDPDEYLAVLRLLSNG